MAGPEDPALVQDAMSELAAAQAPCGSNET